MKQVLEALDSLVRIKVKTCTVPDKVRFFKQMMLKLKDKTPQDTAVIKEVLRQVKNQL